MSKVGIIGWGIVGKATGEGFATNPKNTIVWYDKFIKGPTSLRDVVYQSEFIFICVPTPMFSDHSGIDLSIIDEVVAAVAPLASSTNKIIIIKSTVSPGTTRGYAKRFPKVKFAANPEFLTEINAPWDFLHPDRIVIGAENEDIASRVARLYRELSGPDVKIFITDTATAEMVKYMSNTFLATKIVFANEMYELAQKLKINYDDVKKMVAADPRIGDAFLGVTPFRGFGLKCFPKDTVALLELARKLNVNLSVLKAVWKKNLKIRKVRDWEGIDGAVNDKTKKRKSKKRGDGKFRAAQQ